MRKWLEWHVFSSAEVWTEITQGFVRDYASLPVSLIHNLWLTISQHFFLLSTFDHDRGLRDYISPIRTPHRPWLRTVLSRHKILRNDPLRFIPTPPLEPLKFSTTAWRQKWDFTVVCHPDCSSQDEETVSTGCGRDPQRWKPTNSKLITEMWQMYVSKF